jgi:hypothetical protein
MECQMKLSEERISTIHKNDLHNLPRLSIRYAYRSTFADVTQEMCNKMSWKIGH